MKSRPSEYFKTYAERLDSFALRHNLEVEKYYQNMPVWNFFFSHPLGGHGRLDISCDDTTVYMMKWWTIDDLDKMKRFVRQDDAEKIEGENLEDKMLQAIKEILNWDARSLKSLGSIRYAQWAKPEYQHKYPTVRF